MCALVLLGLTIAVGGGWLDHLDRALYDRLTARGGSAIAYAGVALAWAGSGAATAMAGAALIATLAPAARMRTAAMWLLAIATGAAFEWVVKPVVARRRPEGIVDSLASARFGGELDSFPSGHALSSALLAVIVWRLWRHPAARVAGLTWAAAIAASRIALGVHWVSDVVAGACAGAALGLVWPLPRAGDGPDPRKPDRERPG